MPKNVKGGRKAAGARLDFTSGVPGMMEAGAKLWPKSRRTRGAPPRKGGGRRLHGKPDPFIHG